MRNMAVRPFDVMNLSASLYDPAETGYRDSLDIIKEESVKIQKSFVKIGWYLKHIQDNELYLEDGYANINECAAEQLGYSQSTVSRFIGICEKFSKDHNSPELDEKYSGFDKSQMMEMLPLSAEQLEQVTPDMTVKQIREIKKEKEKKAEGVKKQEVVSAIVLPGQTSIEEDFPEYMPDPKVSDLQEESYATSHNGMESNEQESNLAINSVVDSTYREVETIAPVASEETAQPELPVLKNADQRKEWLKNYKDWGLWYRDENIDVNYYKFDFTDGSRLIVAEYPQRHSYYSSVSKDENYFHLLQKNAQRGGDIYDEKYRCHPDCETELIEFLKNIQKKG